MKYIACSAYDKNWKSNHRQSFYKKALMKIFAKILWKTVSEFFSIKVPCLQSTAFF